MGFGHPELLRPTRARFSEIDVTKLPKNILRGSGYTLHPEDMRHAGLMADEHGVTTYRIPVTHGVEEEVFFVDCIGDEEVGYLRVDHSDEMSFARNIHTKDTFGRRGLGARRLIMANEHTVSVYGQLLHSGLATLQEGRRLWKSLIAKGLVEPTGNLFNHMYRFKAGPKAQG